ncbi:MAG: OmpA family protein [Cytophagales bacterium]
MLRILPIVILSILSCTQSIVAQSKKAQKLYEQGLNELKNRKWDLALQYFNKSVEKSSNFIDAHYQLGILHKVYDRDMEGVKRHFGKILALDSNYKNPSISRVLGEIYLHEGNYPLAKKLFLKYLTFKNEPKNFILKTERYIVHCDYAMANIKNKVDIKPKPLNNLVNKQSKQYFPAVTADEQTLVFTVRDKIGFQEFEDIFISKKINGDWGYAESISDKINSPYINEGTCSISADGKTLVYTICTQTGNTNNCDLFISNKEGNEWSKPKNMGNGINSPFWDSQPTLSPDGKTIYFSSRRPGGYGEEDIWMAKADENFTWTQAVNVGDLINTAGREVAPFIHPSMSTLYFSSDFHPGYGSFDLFVSYSDTTSNWSAPKNLGYPINTFLEESSIFITANGKKAYFSAEASTNSKSERYFLFEFDMPKEVAIQLKSTYAQGTIFDKSNGNPIEANVELINLKSGKVESLLKSDKINGEYLVVLNENSSYALFVIKQGYMYKSHTFDFESEKTFDHVNLDVYLDPIKKGALITLNNIFFETGKYKLEKKSFTELDRLVSFLNQNQNLKVEISGHTDNVGQKQNNIVLSTKRAESVFDYLVENGVAADRILYKGYGDNQPVAPNDLEQSRKLNRRIECKIL